MKTLFPMSYALSLAGFSGALHAIEQYTSVQLAEDYRKYPIDEHGKLRYCYFSLDAIVDAGDDGSTARLCKLPPGRVRVLPFLSRVTSSALGAARTLDIGHAAYNKRGDYGEAQEALNYEAFAADLDVSGAVAAIAFGTVLKYDLYSVAGVEVRARVQGGTWPAGATLSGMIAYLYE